MYYSRKNYRNALAYEQFAMKNVAELDVEFDIDDGFAEYELECASNYNKYY